MNTIRMAKVAAFLAALSLASAAFAATPPAKEGASANADSSGRQPSFKASKLFREFHENAFEVQDWADKLQAYDRAPTLVSADLDAVALDHMRDRINHMDQILERLRSIEKSLPQDQRAEVNQIAPALVELTDTTQAVIHFLNNPDDLLFVPSYEGYLDQIYSESSRVERCSAAPLS